MQSVFTNDFYQLTHDAARKLVVMRRTSQSLTAKGGADAQREVVSALRLLRGQRLLVDVRLAPGNNEPVTEKAVQEFRRQLAELFPVTATIVATAVGRLQLGRLGRERGDANVRIFFDEAEAIAFLMSHPL